MLVTELLFAFIVAAVIFAISFPLFGWRRPTRRSEFAVPLLVFILMFLFAWAGGIWIGPVGPAFRGLYWVPFVLVAVLYVLFLGAIMGAGPMMGSGRSARQQAIAEEEREDSAIRAFGVYFWLVTAILACIIIGKYML